jgi:hypothetical protein
MTVDASDGIDKPQRTAYPACAAHDDCHSMSAA